MCYRDGLLRFVKPAAGRFLRTLDESERDREAAERERDVAEWERTVAERRGASERRAKEAAQARIAELEAQLRAHRDSD